MKRFFTLFVFLFWAVPTYAFGFDVTLKINVAMLPDNHVRISGTTNLPSGTKLILSVEEKMENVFWQQDNCVVSDKGTFSSKSFGTDSGLKDGRYIAEAVMPVPLVQPIEVKKVIGTNGENLTGKLVSISQVGKTVLGPIVSQQIEFTIGRAPDAAQAERKKQTKLAITELKKQLCIHLEQLLSFKDDPDFKRFGFAIGGPYNQWLTSVDELQTAQPTGLNPIPLDLRAMPNYLLLVGMAYMRVATNSSSTSMRERDIRYIDQAMPEIKNAIDFDLYIQSKNR